MKKLDNAKLTGEELDQVAGGSCYDLADDSRFLNSLNGSTDRWGSFKIWAEDKNGPRFTAIKNAWAKLGIGMRCDNPTSTKSYIQYLLIDGDNEIPITQEQARQHAMEVTGHYMSYNDWHW